jgi:hypothetical protein
LLSSRRLRPVLLRRLRSAGGPRSTRALKGGVSVVPFSRRRPGPMAEIGTGLRCCQGSLRTGQFGRPRESGDPGASDRNPWVPAFAGMTDMSMRAPDCGIGSFAGVPRRPCARSRHDIGY